MKNLKFQLVKGMRDFYPQNQALANWLFAKMRETAELFGFEEYEGPTLESLELYAAKSGEELVKSQTYSFEDRGGSKIALRPEMTPTLARMVAQKQNELTKPIKWFNIGARFRYEQPQKGRFRQFYQWDVDLLGDDSPEADAEILAVGATLFNNLDLSADQIRIKVNNRRLMEQKFELISLPKEKYPEILRAIDRRGKMEEVEWDKWLEETGLSKLQIQDLKSILADFDFSRESEELTRIFSTLKDMGLNEYFEYDPTVVRGLDYYTGTVFEAWDTSGEFRAIAGGGRYDNLVEVVGGEKLSGVGFACGDAVLLEVLEKYNKIPKLKVNPAKVLVTIFSPQFQRESIKLASSLRSQGIETDLILDPEMKLDKQLKYADQKRIPYVAILGPEEVAGGFVTIKDMEEGEQKKVTPDEIQQIIK